ncbi:MAG: dehydrogenase E1 component subunit alpha/beta [Sphaerochaetaceae bacterium]|nr:dehydrogenase E1 component subunit alpha/beta [Sphaerochaetaceae bacterium]
MERKKDKQWYREALCLMINSRAFENKTEALFKEGLIHGTTHLANGQEASQAGLSLALEDEDWIVPTHRCHGITITTGSYPVSMFSELFGSREGLAKGLGGSMHMPDSSTCNLGSSAVVGSGIPLAAGIAFEIKYRNKNNVAVAIFGDGATSRGSLHETMNLASVWNLPMLFYCENNGYGMSAPSYKVVSTKDISARALAYSMEKDSVDGNDLEAVYEASKKALDYIRTNKRPYFLEVKTYRTKGHSKSDARVYRTREEEQYWAERDPIILFEQKLIQKGILTKKEIEEIETKAAHSMDIMAKVAQDRAGDVLSQEEVEALVFAPNEELVYNTNSIPSNEVSYREALRLALDHSLEEDKNVYFIGEDIGPYGGCFKVSEGLQKKYPLQIFDTPVSEEGFTGMAVGSAMMGLRPIVEIMYADFHTLMADTIINHGAKTFFMSGGQFKCPIVIRFPEGSGSGHGPQHTQSPESSFMNIPGLKIVAPSNASDAYHLLRAAVKDNNPVLFFEHRALYNSKGKIDRTPVEIGRAKVLKEGKDLTIIAYGRATLTAMDGAKLLESKGIEATVVDLRTIKPLDEETIRRESRKTKRVLLVQDTPTEGGVMGEVSALITEDKDTFNCLVSPVVRLGGKNTPIPFSKTLEEKAIPSASDVFNLGFKLFKESIS